MEREIASFRHVSDPFRYFQGDDCLTALERELGRAGSERAVLVSAGSVARNDMLMDRIMSAAGGRIASVFADVKAHSPVPSVEAAAEMLKANRADAVVAVGGGSAMVTARAASILLAENKPVGELCTYRDADGKIVSPRLNAPKLRQFVVPTTPTSAIVKAGSAVHDPEGNRRCALYDPKTRAQAVFVDPEMILSAPEKLVESACLDTFVLAAEVLLANRADAISDGLLLHVLRLTLDVYGAGGSGDSAEARARLMSAAVMCGRGTDNLSAGVATALGHAIASYCEADNGITKYVLLPHVMAFNERAAADTLPKIAFAMSGHTGTNGAMGAVRDTLSVLTERLSLPTRLRDIGVSKDCLPKVAADAMDDWWIRGNPRTIRGASELEDLLEDAW